MHPTEMHSFTTYFYRMLTKLRGGNFFSRVCLSVCSQGDPHMTITQGRTVQPPLRHLPRTSDMIRPKYFDHWFKLVSISSTDKQILTIN